MSTKGIVHVVIFLLVTIGLHGFFLSLGWPGSIALLILIPLGYAFAYLIKLMINIGSGDGEDARYSLLIGLLFVLISIKLSYVYYNFIFILIASLATLFVAKKYRNASSKKKSVLVLIGSLALVVCLIPDSMLLRYYNLSGTQTYIPNLSSKHFQGEIPDSSEFAAMIYSETRWKSNMAYNYPQATMVSLMYTDRSWVREQYEQDTSLMNHEQGHFDITEIYTRMARDSVTKSWGKTSVEIENIINYFSLTKDSVQDNYDAFTDHGLDSLNQYKCNRWIKFKMKSL